MNVTINKASLKDGLFLKGDYDEKMKDASRNVKFDDSNPVHDDLKSVFDELGPHLCVLCEQPEAHLVTCTGFSIGTNESGITLIGYRELSEGRVLNLVSPFLKWEGDGFYYHESDLLGELIESAKGEVKAYLFDGKHAPEKQLSLFDDQGEPKETVTVIVGEEAGVTIPLGEVKEKKKRGRKPKEYTPDSDQDQEF